MNIRVILSFLFIISFAYPMHITSESSFASTAINFKEEISLLSTEAEEDLQQENETSWQHCLSKFQQKGGTFLRLDSSNLSEEKNTFALLPGDAVYPVCSGGFCRSQTLWAVLRDYQTVIHLMAPHAARYGFDPYNGKLNWHRNDAKEAWVDDFALWAKEPKKMRFGYDVFSSWHKLESASEEELKQITSYFNEHYFGPRSCQNPQRRIFFSFDKNTHVILLRLNQSNESLRNVWVVHLPLKDLVTHPLAEWSTTPRSVMAYDRFSKLLLDLIDLKNISIK